MSWLLIVIGAVVGLIVADVIYLAWYLNWESRNTRGLAYYGKPLAERRAIKRRIRRYARLAMPAVRLLAPAARKRPTLPTFVFEGVPGPPRVSSPDVFARAKRYRPQPEDVFVTTQMRCGTTWMQQVVYEIVTRGRTDWGASDGHLYAISPWIDAINSVSMEAAPLIGAPPTRIIKCHLPTVITPYSDAAKYIYVTRHPVSCFASIVDYNRTLLGPLMPPVQVFADWFCSDQMYWRPWPAHVMGWWEWAQRRPNVLFVHFEDMKADFAGVRDRVAEFLGCSLTPDEQQRVSTRCSFQYMADHEEWFEMSPPTMFSVDSGRFLASGKAARHEDVTPAIRTQILEYCRRALRGGPYPAAQFYPDLTDDGPRGS